MTKFIMEHNIRGKKIYIYQGMYDKFWHICNYDKQYHVKGYVLSQAMDFFFESYDKDTGQKK